MTITNYGKLYHKLNKSNIKVYTALSGNLVICIILALFLRYDRIHDVLEFFTLIYLLLQGFVAFVNNDGEVGGFHQVISFLKVTPLPSSKIIGYNFLVRLWNFDQLIFFVLAGIVLGLNHVPWFEALLFYVRLLSIILIAQSVESVVYVISKRFFYRTFVQAASFLGIFLIVQSNAWKNYDRILTIFRDTFHFDEFLVVVAVLAYLNLIPLTERILFGKKTTEPRVLVPASQFIASLVSKCLFFHRELQTVVRVLLLRYLRDSEIQTKYTKLLILAGSYSVFSLMISHNPNSILNLAWLLGLMFFGEFDVNRLFQEKAVLTFFPLTNKTKKLASDIVSYLFYLFFCLVVFLILELVTRIGWPEIKTGILAVLLFGVIRCWFVVPVKLNTRGIFRYSVIYGGLCLCFVVLFQFFKNPLIMPLALLLVVLVYFLKMTRKEVEWND